MSSLLVERVNVVTAGFAVAIAYLVVPMAAQAATCSVVPNSFDCMRGSASFIDSNDKTADKTVKVAALTKDGVASDASPTDAGTKVASGARGRKARSSAGRWSHARKSASSRSGRSARREVTRKGWKTRNGGFQARGGVVTSCFPASLRALLAQVASHYGRSLVITSGYRSPSHNRRIGGARESQHVHCLAADFYIPGVSPGALAAYVKSMPGRGGVGTYCGNRTIHLDVGIRREWHWGCGGHGRYARRHAGKRRYASARSRGSRS